MKTLSWNSANGLHVFSTISKMLLVDYSKEYNITYQITVMCYVCILKFVLVNITDIVLKLMLLQSVAFLLTLSFHLENTSSKYNYYSISKLIK